MSIDPAPRVRTRTAPVTVAPPPRVRTAPVASISPPPRSRPSTGKLGWNIPDHLPLPFMGQTHNGYRGPGLADPRFAPLVIVMDPRWAKHMPDYVRERIDQSLKWEAGDKFPSTPIYAVPTYLTEWALRQYLGKALLADDVYEALHRHIIAEEPNWNDPQRSMIQLVGEKLVIDMTKASGPFYMDTLLAIEIHYAKQLRPCNPVQ